MAIWFHSAADDARAWRAALAASGVDEPFATSLDDVDPATIDVALVWKPPAGSLARLPNLRAVFSLGAGVDGLLADPTIPAHLPIVRMIDPGLSEAMAGFVAASVLRWRHGFDRLDRAQAERAWRWRATPPASEQSIGLMGLGELGSACARALAPFGFALRAWSRTPKSLEGVAHFDGASGLRPFLDGLDMLVCLLPLTPETRDMLDRSVFERLAPGAGLINVARGEHLVEQDLLEAIDRGWIAWALLDVFRREPLPADHPFWRNEAIHVTPHVAAYADPRTAAPRMARNLLSVRAGEPPLDAVDRRRGY